MTTCADTISVCAMQIRCRASYYFYKYFCRSCRFVIPSAISPHIAFVRHSQTKMELKIFIVVTAFTIVSVVSGWDSHHQNSGKFNITRLKSNVVVGSQFSSYIQYKSTLHCTVNPFLNVHRCLCTANDSEQWFIGL